VRVRIWRPRLLAVVVVALAAVGGTAAALAWPGGEEAPGLAVPANESEPRPATEEELARALEIIEEDGQVYEVNGGQPFTVRPHFTYDRPDGRRVVWVELVWEKPVDSAGPWTGESCRGLVRARGTYMWRNLRSVSVEVDLTNGEVRTFSTSSLARELGAVGDPSFPIEGEIIEQPEGWSLSVGSPEKPFRCPEGYEDD